ncbi:hypothetical protein POX_c04188 [Penicillium oxalicum]|uniref:hypothetical protein n=1 Tax=Penicillium oxalicum TaxID=69781 RepID=UPI0020B64BA6|nr:hypothetical protein POX_c04188 [Penicillium oxalicum]KAI2791331.1 hypothetical protein POX_c04188 [Penicillium oxalicum]
MYCQWIILAPWALQNLLNDWYPSNTEDVPSVLKYSTGRNQRDGSSATFVNRSTYSPTVTVVDTFEPRS